MNTEIQNQIEIYKKNFEDFLQNIRDGIVDETPIYTQLLEQLKYGENILNQYDALTLEQKKLLNDQISLYQSLDSYEVGEGLKKASELILQILNQTNTYKVNYAQFLIDQFVNGLIDGTPFYDQFLAQIKNERGEIEYNAETIALLSSLETQQSIYKDNLDNSRKLKNRLKDIFTKNILFSVGISNLDESGRREILNNFKKSTTQSLLSRIPSPVNIASKILAPNRSGRVDRNYDYGEKSKSDIINAVTSASLASISSNPNLYDPEGDVKDAPRVLDPYINNDENDELFKVASQHPHFISFGIVNDDDAIESYLAFKMINFTGFTDTDNIKWEPVKYLGNPQTYYTYSGTERSVSFTFEVQVMEFNDIVNIYSKLNALKSFAYGKKFTQDGMIRPYLIKLSIAKYFKKISCFISSIIFTPDDELYFQDGKPTNISVSISCNIVHDYNDPYIQGVYSPIRGAQIARNRVPLPNTSTTPDFPDVDVYSANSQFNTRLLNGRIVTIEEYNRYKLSRKSGLNETLFPVQVRR